VAFLFANVACALAKELFSSFCERDRAPAPPVPVERRKSVDRELFDEEESKHL